VPLRVDEGLQVGAAAGYEDRHAGRLRGRGRRWRRHVGLWVGAILSGIFDANQQGDFWLVGAIRVVSTTGLRSAEGSAK
jgi:hypothetical protein